MLSAPKPEKSVDWNTMPRSGPGPATGVPLRMIWPAVGDRARRQAAARWICRARGTDDGDELLSATAIGRLERARRRPPAHPGKRATGSHHQLAQARLQGKSAACWVTEEELNEPDDADDDDPEDDLVGGSA